MARVVPTTETDSGAEPEDDALPPAWIVTPEEGRRRYDEAARTWMGTSGDEFLRRWDAGEIHDLADTPGHFTSPASS